MTAEVADQKSPLARPRSDSLAGVAPSSRDVAADTASIAAAAPRSFRARPTRAEELRLRIADDIVSGALAPGAALDETELARRFNVSRTPVREALRMLASSGLVQAPAHRTALVAQPTHPDLIGMFEVMAELESLCAGYAAERMSGAERHGLTEVHEMLRALIKTGDPQHYHEVNEAFHATIYRGAHNNYLAELTLATRMRVQPFRRAQFRNLGRLAKSHAEHDRVVQAIMRGERMRAAQTMYAHIITVRDEYQLYAGSLTSEPHASP